MSTNRRMLFLIPCSDLIPSGKVRVLNYLPYLQERGIECKVMNYHHPLILQLRRRIHPQGRILFLFSRFLKRLLQWIDSLYQRSVEWRLLLSAPNSDVVMIQWEPPPGRIIQKLLKRNQNLFYDFDDFVFLDPKLDSHFLMAHVKGVIAGSQYLKDYAKRFNNNVVLIPSSIPIERFDKHRQTSRRNPGSRMIIGWVGSDSTLHNLEILQGVFDSLEQEFLLQLKLLGVGNRKSPIPQTGNLEIVTVKYYDEEEMIRSVLSFDIGIVPLKESEVTRGKTSLKALVYMGAGIPVVCSPVGENLVLVEDGINGFFASNPQEWIEKLRRLIQDKSLRSRMGKNGLTLVRERYNTQTSFELFYETLRLNFSEGIEERKGHRLTSTGC